MNGNSRADEGEIFALIRAQRAGKRTVFNRGHRVYQFPTPTRHQLRGDVITRKCGSTTSFPVRTRRRRRLKSATGEPSDGIAVPSEHRLFHNMFGAGQTLLVGLDAHHKSGLVERDLRAAPLPHEEREGRVDATELLEFVGIGRAHETAKNLPYGDSAAARDRPRAGDDPSCCCWTSRPE